MEPVRCWLKLNTRHNSYVTLQFLSRYFLGRSMRIKWLSFCWYSLVPIDEPCVALSELPLKHLIAEHHNEHHCDIDVTFVFAVDVVNNAVVVKLLFLFRVTWWLRSIETAGVMTKKFSKRFVVTFMFRFVFAAIIRSANHLVDSSLLELSSGLTIW